MTRRRGWIVPAVTAAIIATALPANACSCAQGDPRTQLKASDGAFIGTLLSKTPDGDWDSIYRFRVDEAVKGTFGEFADVHSASDGAACGLEVPIGGQTGLFLDGSSDTGWDSNLCRQISPEELREAARPMPEPDGEGPIKMLVGGKWGDVGIVALDAEGRTLSYGTRPGGSADLEVCPGSTRFLERPWRGEPRLAVRDTASMDVVDVIEVPKNLAWTWCLESDASRLLFATLRYREPLSHSRLYGYENGTRTLLYDGTATNFVRADDQMFMTEGRYGRKVSVFDVASGAKTFVARVPRYAGPPRPNSDGSRIVLTTGANREALILIDRTGGSIRVRENDLGIGQSGTPYWIDDDRIAYLPGGYDNSRVKVFDVRLDEVDRLPGPWYTMDEDFLASTAYGMGWGILFRAGLPDGPAEVLREFPTTTIYSLETVPDEVHAAEP